MKQAWILLIAFLALPLRPAAEPAKFIKNDSVRDKPFTSGKVLASLKAGQNVDIQKREGAWYYVTFTGGKGWAPMLSVRRSKQAPAASAGSLSKTATGRSATGGVVSTTGVRGLTEETLKTATFDERAVAAIEKYRASQADAAAFARAGGIQAHTVPSLGGMPGIGGGK